MTNGTDNLVVAHLREIHAELQGISAKLDAQGDRIDNFGKPLHDFRRVTEHTLGPATMNQIRVGRLQARHNATEAWQRRNERLDQLERRLDKVEQKLDADAASRTHNLRPAASTPRKLLRQRARPRPGAAPRANCRPSAACVPRVGSGARFGTILVPASLRGARAECPGSSSSTASPSRSTTASR
jgi:hypothetical protein